VGMCFVSQLQELGSQLTLARTGQTMESHAETPAPWIFWFIRVCFLWWGLAMLPRLVSNLDPPAVAS